MPTRRHVMQILAAAAPVALAGCGDAHADPAAAWRNPGAGQRDPRLWALAHAILAPNPHNRQPWLIDLAGDDAMIFYADTTRLLPATDPPNRQITVGCGAFLELLDLAARESGHRADITLWPRGEPQPNLDTRPVAQIRMVRDAAVSRDPLFTQITRRHTNRAPYDMARTPSAADLATVAAVARRTPGLASGTLTDSAPRARLIDIGRRAYEIESHTRITQMESVNLMRIGAAEIEQHRDGIALSGPMVEGLRSLRLISREALADSNSFAFKSGIDMWRKMIEGTPGFFWLRGADNSRTTQIAAGRAYARTHLTATALGLSMQPWSMPLQEYAEVATPYREAQAALGATPAAPLQMLTRIGYAKAAPPAPRRGLAQLIRG